VLRGLDQGTSHLQDYMHHVSGVFKRLLACWFPQISKDSEKLQQVTTAQRKLRPPRYVLGSKARAMEAARQIRNELRTDVARPAVYSKYIAKYEHFARKKMMQIHSAVMCELRFVLAGRIPEEDLLQLVDNCIVPLSAAYGPGHQVDMDEVAQLWDKEQRFLHWMAYIHINFGLGFCVRVMHYLSHASLTVHRAWSTRVNTHRPESMYGIIGRGVSGSVGEVRQMFRAANLPVLLRRQEMDVDV